MNLVYVRGEQTAVVPWRIAAVTHGSGTDGGGNGTEEICNIVTHVRGTGNGDTSAEEVAVGSDSGGNGSSGVRRQQAQDDELFFKNVTQKAARGWPNIQV